MKKNTILNFRCGDRHIKFRNYANFRRSPVPCLSTLFGHFMVILRKKKVGNTFSVVGTLIGIVSQKARAF